MRFNRLVTRYWWFVLLLIVAGSILLSNLISGYRNAKTSNFSVSDIKGITRIVISNPKNSVTLSKTENEMWVVNGSQSANPKSVDLLLRIVERLKPSGPAPLFANDSLSESIKNSGIYVEIYENRTAIKKMYLVSAQIGNMSTFGQIKGAKTIYNLEMPGSSFNIISAFNPLASYWQSNRITLPPTTDIFAFEVELPNKPELSFRVDIMDNRSFRLFNLLSGYAVQKFDSLKVAEILTQLADITYTQIVNLSSEEKAAIDYSEPDYIYTLYTTGGKTIELRIYPIPVYERLDEFGRPIRYDLNRLYLTHSGTEDVYIVNYIDIHKLLRKLTDFNLHQ